MRCFAWAQWAALAGLRAEGIEPLVEDEPREPSVRVVGFEPAAPPGAVLALDVVAQHADELVLERRLAA